MPLALSHARAAPLAVGALCWLVSLLLASPARAQLPGSGEATPDSVARRLGLPEGHSPRRALRRAAMVPGWGQYYNRQYWKIPVVAAGLGGVVFGIVYSWDRYLLYRNAWRFEQQPENYPQYEEERVSLQAVVNEFGVNAIKDRRNQFRRWRELSLLGSGLFYVLQMADAFVSAHLLGFEVREDLSFQMAPRPQGGLTATFRLSL